MKEEFINYLKSIDMANILIERVKTIYEFYKVTCPDEISDIFVSEYIKKDGRRVYEDLRFFSSRYCMKATNFLSEDKFSMYFTKERFAAFLIQKENYDFKKATDDSRFLLNTYAIWAGIEALYKASKENCDHLRDLLLTYIIPNLK